jgi:chemotaxis-related protein WspB
MLLLIFQAGSQTYGLNARSVLEVAPYPECTPLAHAPAWAAGLIRWRGHPMPVIDLSALLTGTPAPPLLSTRLIVVDYETNGRSHPLGLVAEKAVETVLLEDARQQPRQIAVPDASYLAGASEVAGRLIHRVNIGDLLPAPVRVLLFPVPEAE